MSYALNDLSGVYYFSTVSKIRSGLAEMLKSEVESESEVRLIHFRSKDPMI